MNKLSKGLITLSSVLLLGGCSKNYESALNGGGDSANHVYDSSTSLKIKYEATYSLYCEDINATKTLINNKINELGGHISKQTETTYNSNIVYKVPVEHLDEALDYIDSIDPNKYKSVTSSDVTSTYNQYTSKINNLNIAKTTYTNMLSTPNLSVDDLIKLTDKITNIEADIEYYTNMYNTLVNEIENASIDISFYEGSYEEPTFFEEYLSYIVEVFIGIGAFILYSLPFALIALGISFLVRYIKKKKNNKKKEI